MKTLRERQIHMAQLIKAWDRFLVEKHGKMGFPFYHYQKPDAEAGERDNVCIVTSHLDRVYLPYGSELEAEVESARRWVKTGEGPVPHALEKEKKARNVTSSKVSSAKKSNDDSEEDIDNPRDRGRVPHSRRLLTPPITSSRARATASN